MVAKISFRYSGPLETATSFSLETRTRLLDVTILDVGIKNLVMTIHLIDIATRQESSVGLQDHICGGGSFKDGEKTSHTSLIGKNMLLQYMPSSPTSKKAFPFATNSPSKAKLFKGNISRSSRAHPFSTIGNTSMTISNIIGPLEKISMGGCPVKSFYFMVTHLPQKLLLACNGSNNWSAGGLHMTTGNGKRARKRSKPAVREKKNNREKEREKQPAPNLDRDAEESLLRRAVVPAKERRRGS
ncbi:hypothetical protein EJ110_NYTH43322 [Nymphaea thermarum]|nr:hypothetical protein EJ110_NYTH43322 [Nymphaea thermarum]